MPNGYYGGAPNAFAGGRLFSKEMRKRTLQENALKALIGRFGDEAALPDDLATLQATEQRTQLQPHVVGAAERATAGAEANVEQFGPQAGDPEADETERARNEQRRAILHRGVTALRMVRDREGDLPGALQQFSTILSRIGMPPDELTQMQEEILTDPDSLDELQRLLGADESAAGVRAVGNPIAVYDDATGRSRLLQTMSDGSTRIVPDVSPAATVLGEQRNAQSAERVSQGWQRLTLDQAKARGFNAPEGHEIWVTPEGRIVADPIPGTEQERAMITAQEKRAQLLADAEATLNSEVAQSERVLRWGNRALARMDDLWFRNHDPISGQARRTLANRPGTATFEVASDIDQMKGVIAIDELLRIKLAGGTLGQVTEKELELLKNKLSALSIEREPGPLKEDLAEVLELYTELIRKSAGAIQQIQEERRAPPPQRYGPQDAAPGAAPGSPAPAGRAPLPPNATPEQIRLYYSGGG